MAINTARVLQSIALYTAQANASSASRPMRLAVIDPAYSSGAPKVTFEGETSLSTKTYPSLGGYLPVASDRVMLVPVGNTYLIAGSVVTTPTGLDGSTITTGTIAQARLPQVGAWTAITLGTNVAYSDTAFSKPSYSISPDARFVYLRGLMHIGGAISVGATIGTIGTAGAQPAKRTMVCAIRGPASGSASAIRIDIAASLMLTENALVSGDVVSLDGLVYTTDATI